MKKVFFHTTVNPSSGTGIPILRSSSTVIPVLKKSAGIANPTPNGHNFPLTEPKCKLLGILERSYHVEFEKKI
jgi:hypothetical protein